MADRPGPDLTSDGEHKASLGRRIRAARLKRTFSRTMLAAFCGVTEQVVYQWESGKAAPSRHHSSRLAMGLGVPWDAFLLGDEAWDRHVATITAVNAPDVFAPPTQWTLNADAMDIGEPYRVKEEVGAPVPEPPPAPATVAKPVPQRRAPPVRYLPGVQCQACGGELTVITKICVTCEPDDI